MAAVQLGASALRRAQQLVDDLAASDGDDRNPPSGARHGFVSTGTCYAAASCVFAKGERGIRDSHSEDANTEPRNAGRALNPK